MRRLLAVMGLAGLGFGSLLMLAGPAGAASASGCSGSATSFDSSGSALDKVSAPGAGGTKDNPFEVNPDGHVKHNYNVKSDIAGGKWDVKLLGPVKFGDDISATSSNTGGGDEAMSSYLKPGGIPILVGLIKADVEIKNKAGNTVCTYSGWIKIGGSVLESPIFYLSIIFVLLGLLFGFMCMGEPVV